MSCRPLHSSSISIVLPAFDEAGNIERAVERCLEYGRSRFVALEVIVVDDGSTDGTAEKVRRLAAEHAEVRLIAFPSNRGYGAALSAGFAAARHSLVFFTDADLQFDVAELDLLIPRLDRADVVLGYRIERRDPKRRRLLSWGYNRLVGVLFGVRVRDVDCSFKLFSRSVVDRLELHATDFFIDTEMIARTKAMGGRIVEVGVHHFPREAGESKVRLAHIPKTLWTVARMWLRIHRPLQLGRAGTAAGVP